MKNSLFIFSLLVGFSTSAFAQRVGLTLGVSQVHIDSSTGVDINNDQSLQFGALFYQPMTDSVDVRLGALLAQNSLNIGSGNSEVNLKISNINVPLTAGLHLGERVLVFGGPVISVNASKSCEGVSGASCSVNSYKVRGTDIQLSLGFNVLLTSELGLELSYDKMGGKPFEGASGGQVVNVNFQYVIE
ncbi:MAG: hypothetical protein RJB66_245 [Pseudomonadota bacterium]